MLSNAYFLAKFRFDTAENEPAKNCKIFGKCIFEKCIFQINQSFWVINQRPPPTEPENGLHEARLRQVHELRPDEVRRPHDLGALRLQVLEDCFF